MVRKLANVITLWPSPEPVVMSAWHSTEDSQWVGRNKAGNRQKLKKSKFPAVSTVEVLGCASRRPGLVRGELATSSSATSPSGAGLLVASLAVLAMPSTLTATRHDRHASPDRELETPVETALGACHARPLQKAPGWLEGRAAILSIPRQVPSDHGA